MNIIKKKSCLDVRYYSCSYSNNDDHHCGSCLKINITWMFVYLFLCFYVSFSLVSSTVLTFLFLNTLTNWQEMMVCSSQDNYPLTCSGLIGHIFPGSWCITMCFVTNQTWALREVNTSLIMWPLLCAPGVCLNCEDNTQGSNCDECKPGFYRGPGAPLTEACAPCPCSNSTSTGTCHTGQSPLLTHTHTRGLLAAFTLLGLLQWLNTFDLIRCSVVCVY